MDEKRKELLTKMLSNPAHPWRKLTTMANAIGANEEETKRLLLEIDARGSTTGNGNWGLIARVGLPGAVEEV
jgi:hypothetical protein